MDTDDLTSRTTWRRPGSSPYIKDANFIDRLAASLDRHRAFSVILVCLIMILLDYCFNIPIEWLLFSYFTFTIFFNAFSISIAVFIVFFTLILTTSALTYLLVSYRVTNFLASSVVNASLVHGFHGLDIVGWMLVSILSAARYWLPWCNTLPPDFMAPVAAHCTSFGFLWILYHFAFFVHSSFDQVGLFFGLVIPKPPVIYIKNIKETGTSIYWTLPEKPSVEKYLIEINGVLAGESDKQETSVEIMGLSADSWYKIRVWAVSNSRIRTPSQCIVIKTLPIVPASFPAPNKVKKETTSKPVESKDSTLKTKNDTKKEETSQMAITEEKIDALRSECDIVKKQRQEIAQNAQEVEKQSKIEEEKIRNELERLRALKRAEEEPKMKLKSRLKSLDDSKIEAEAARTKLERELKLEQNSKQHSFVALRNKEKEKESHKNSLETAKDKIRKAKVEFNNQKAELEESIKKLHNDISFAEKELSNVTMMKEELWNEIADKKDEFQRILNENERIAEPDNKLRNQTKSLDQEHRVLFQNYLQLQDLERNIKEKLQRLDHEKWSIMEELNKARRLGRLDNAYTGGYRLFGPASGETLPEFSLSGPNEIHHPPNTSIAPVNYSTVGSGSFFSTLSEIPTAPVPTTVYPSTTVSQPQSLFSGFTGGFTPSSGAVGEKRNVNNPLRNMAINNNSAPDLLAVLGPGTIPNPNGFGKREVNDSSSSTPVSKPFRPRHRYQSSHGSVHSLFEYGPVGAIDDPMEYAPGSVSSISNMPPSRSATVSPEFDSLATSVTAMFPTVRSPSPVRTITPPSSITNGRIFRGRELNFFGRSSNSNETPNSRPQLPSGILEVASGGTEFPSIKKVTSNNLVDRSTSPVLVDGRSRNSSMSSQRISFASRFEPFSGWPAKGNHHK